MKYLIALLFACLTITSYGQATGNMRISWWNGTTWVSGTISGTGAVYISGSAPAAASVSQLAAAVGFGSQTASISSGTATVDLSLGNSIGLTVTGTSVQMAFTNPVAGFPYFLRVNSGTFVNPTVRFPNGSTQSLSGTNNYVSTGTGTAVVDIVPFIYSGTTYRILDASPYYTP